MNHREPIAVSILLVAVLLSLPVAVVAADDETTYTFATAAAHYENRDIEKARAAYSYLVTRNPFKGSFWYRKGVTEFYTERYDDCIRSLGEAIELGTDVKFSKYVIGASYARKEDFDEAARWFDEVIALDPSWIAKLQTDVALADFNTSEHAARLYGVEGEDVSEVEGLLSDVAYLHRTLTRAHYDINIKTSEEQWDAAYETLRAEIARMSPNEQYLALMKFTALAGDAHTNIWPQSGERLQFHMIPVSIYAYSDGFFVRGAAWNTEVWSGGGLRGSATGGSRISSKRSSRTSGTRT